MCVKKYELKDEDSVIYTQDRMVHSVLSNTKYMQTLEYDSSNMRIIQECKECKIETVHVRILTTSLKPIYKCEKCKKITM
jgi:hypothetical protein